MLLSRQRTAGLLAVLLSALLCQLAVALESPSLDTDSRNLASDNSSSAACQNQGLSGECNGAVCCCYKGGGGFVKITPVGNACKRSFGGEQVWVTIVLAAIVIIVTLAAGCYFNGRLGISPYKAAAPTARTVA